MRRLVLVGTLVAGLSGGIAFAQSASSALGTVRLTRSVKADGKPLAAGTYQVRLTDEDVKPAVGQSPGGERWVEFVRAGKVVGREVATVVASDEIGKVAKRDPMPKINGSRVDTLKGGDYVRLWINRAGTNYLINMPPTG